MISACNRRYVETEINTTSPARLVLALYEGAINFSLRAKRRMGEGDWAGKGELIGKTIDIVFELNKSLDMAAGGELAANFRRLYMYCIDRLLEANMKKDPAQIDAVIRVLCTLKEGWEGVVKAETEGVLTR